MKKTLMMVLLVAAGAVQAENEMAWTPNKAGGSMFFTYTECVYISSGVRVPESYYVYSTDTTGTKITDGCYKYKYPFYMIQWNKGGNTNINVNTVSVLK